ncbi:methyltransferase domain-containing protein [Terribacillus sp. 179-K 1B1 HS]|uniref:methyltransferase domain-containing protein n=1 Tax=Terribacillus sp. 179-K 1B1 HS TaxID=3142388 RepID=UPI0039A2F90F
MKKDDHVLDLGAGTGYISFGIAELVKTVYTFNYDEDILKYLDTVAKERDIANIITVSGKFKDIQSDNHFLI